MSTRFVMIIVLLLVVILSIIELMLRDRGLREFPLYRVDERYEYVFLPDQILSPNGNLIQTNGIGLRSDPILKKKGKRVLVIGDSVINGTYSVHQDSLATNLLEDHLNEIGQEEFHVINLSMNSWGPSNAMAFIEAHGDFEPDIVILVVSSHDAYDNMTFEPVVGENTYYPGKHPWSATVMAIQKYSARYRNSSPAPEYLEIQQEFNSGFTALKDHFELQNIPFTIYLHYELNELRDAELDQKGKEILNFAARAHVPIRLGIDLDEKAEDYMDVIHFNTSGQRALSNALYTICQEDLLRSKNLQ